MNLIDELYRSGCLDHSGLTELQLEVKRTEGRRDKLEEELRPKLGEEGILNLRSGLPFHYATRKKSWKSGPRKCENGRI